MAAIRNHSVWRRAWDVSLRALTPADWPVRLSEALGLVADLGLERHEVTVPASLGAGVPLRIAFAADFHAGPMTPRRLHDRAAQLLADADADVVLLGGDFVSLRAGDGDALIDRLGAVPARIGRFAVLGNHDYWTDPVAVTSRLERAGIALLTNRHIRLPAPFGGVSLCGLDDHTSGAPDAGRAFHNAAGVRIVLMHAPSGLLDIGPHPFHLALCGHTHGGQVALPGGRPVVVAHGPLSRRYSSGRFALGRDRVLLVTRGVGCGGLLPFRWNAPAAVMVCTVTGVTAQSSHEP